MGIYQKKLIMLMAEHVAELILSTDSDGTKNFNPLYLISKGKEPNTLTVVLLWPLFYLLVLELEYLQ